MNQPTNNSRRDFIKKSAYAVPVVLTLKAAPSLAGQGSHHKDHKKDKHQNKPGNKHSNKNKHSNNRGRGR